MQEGVESTAVPITCAPNLVQPKGAQFDYRILRTCELQPHEHRLGYHRFYHSLAIRLEVARIFASARNILCEWRAEMPQLPEAEC